MKSVKYEYIPALRGHWATQWLLWAFVGLRWPSLAVVGYCGFSWTCVGLRWPSLATVGLHGPALAFVDLCWPLLTCVGRRWLLWVFMGLHWPSLAVVGRRWLLGNKNKMKILYIKKITHLVWALFFPCCPSKPPSTI